MAQPSTPSRRAGASSARRHVATTSNLQFGAYLLARETLRRLRERPAPEPRPDPALRSPPDRG
jgi:hypothetical protein